jgi:hypothetical protein
MTPAELLDEIDAAGGSLTVLPDRSFECQNIPPSLRAELVRLQSSVVAILLGECEPKTFVPMDTRKLKKFLGDAQTAGVIFRRTQHFFEAEVPKGLQVSDFEPTIRANAEKIFELLFPTPTRSRPKRPKCLICKTGQGCRTTGIGHELKCPLCGHACRCHRIGMKTQLREYGYPDEVLNDPQWGTPDYCSYSAYCDANGQHAPCPCPGWPVAPKPVKPLRKTKATPIPARQMELTEVNP